MATITYQQLQGVRDAMEKLSSDMRSKIVEVIERVGIEDENALRMAILEELAPILEAADLIAAELAAAVFNGWRYAALGLTLDTVTESAFTAGKIEAMANTAAKKAREGAAIQEIVDIVYNRAAYDMRRSYGQTMISNVRRDPTRPRFARVPGRSEHYAAGCPFCRMLASRGFVYLNKQTAGESDHYHADCTCQPVASWDKSPKVEGYDPEKYLQEYLDARAYAKDNLEEIRERESVTTKDQNRYRYGIKVGIRKDVEYGDAKHITANDVAAGYRDLGIAKKLNPDKPNGESSPE